MEVHEAIEKLKRMPADKQRLVLDLIEKLNDAAGTARQSDSADLWEVLETERFSSGDGGLSEDVERFTGRRY